MQNPRRYLINILSKALRIIMVLMIAVPTFSQSGTANAMNLTARSSIAASDSQYGIQNSATQPLPFSQAWTDTNLISVSDDWSSVPGIVGYRGDDLTTLTGTDPQTLLMDGTTTPIDVNANQTLPNTFTTGGVTEFQLADPVIALAGSGTADAPFILLYIDTQGFQDIQVTYNLRDLEDGADNAVQQVALHYRIGSTGNFTNLPEGYVADATIGGATMSTLVSVTLPSDANNQPLVQLRIMTTNAVGNDEWVGIDDISIIGTPSGPEEPKINEFSASTAGTDVEYVEIIGSASTAYTAYTALEIEGDTGNVGVIDEVISVGSTNASGFWLASLPANALENGTLTLLLVKDFTGALGNDLDTNEDGVFDTTPWSAVTDSVSVNDGGATDKTYGLPSLGPNYDGYGIYAPGGASRWPDGFDTEAMTDWIRNDFDLAGIPGYTGTISLGEAYNTPGEPNTIYVPPEVTFTIDKTGPGSVETNESFEYALTAQNGLGVPATNVVITDSIPLSLTVGSISDGGELLAGNVISWTVPTIADGTTVTRTVSVTAPGSVTTLVNYDYGMTASEWLTFTTGAPVTTTVNAPPVITPIADARAAGSGWSGTIEGNVYVVPNKFNTRSFAIQDATGGMYIFSYTYNPPTMALGDVVRVQGTITIYHGLMELNPTSAVVISSGTPPDPLVTPTGSVGPTQGKLVQIQGTVTDFFGTTNKTVNIDDGSGETMVYIYGLTGINTTGITPGIQMRFIGMSGAYDTPQVNPRYQSDLYIFPPEVTGTNPANGATGVSLYRPLTATFNHAMDPSTINTASFTLADAVGPVSGTVSYDDGTHTAIFTPDTILSENTPYTATLTTDIKDLFNIALSSVYTWTFTSGIIDIIPPTIVGQSPAPGEIDVPLDADVVITFSEDLNPATIDQSDFLLASPYGDVPFGMAYNPNTYAITLNPDFNLLPTSEYTVTVLSTIDDWAGNAMSGDSTWTFTTMVEPPMYAYLGDLHNHTSNSDGSGTPAQALAAGEAAGLDFMAITDHSYAISDSEWDATWAAVEAATNEDFLAIRGFEYTQGAEGHINVYNTVRHAVRTNTGCGYCDYTPNLEAGATVAGFYGWLDTTGTIGMDEAGTVMQFNHPGWINFNDWRYHPEVSDVARLEEVGNGNGTSYAFSEDQYIRSLDYGWKVGATNNADTHTADWGTNTDHRTGVVMSELTKDALLEALRARRTYASEDKNYNLTMKANGAWMGSEIPNVGYIDFEISGADPDGELTNLVEIITDQGMVAAQFTPNSANFTLAPNLDITTGVHYFYIRVTQADGDRIVSSPVWTTGVEDISVTDLLIQPTIPTIYNPSLLTVRVTNRVEVTRTVTVSLDINGIPLDPSVEVAVPGNNDAFANFSWQPDITGEVTVTARISGAPTGDNPDDNQKVLNLTVTDEHLPLILIDAGKGNLNATGSEMQMFINDLSAHRYNVLKNLDALTAADLDPDIVKLLIITAPENAYSSAELTAIADFVAAGGNLWLIGMSDYTGSVSWADTVANRENDILAAIESATGSTINMRVNDDEIIDGDDNNGYVFGPRWSIFPSADTTGIGVNVEAITSWSANSLRGLTVTDPLTPTTPGVLQIVQGDLDSGYGSPPWYDPYHTSNEDADNGNDAYIYNPGWVYPATPPIDAIPVPMSAATDLPGNAGRILLYGDSNDAFTTFAYTAGDGLQNELFNLEAVMWLMGEPLQKSTIAEARAEAEVNQPDNLDKLVWVEGYITAAYGEFFNVLYVQDGTGGITVHAPAGDIDASVYTRGTHGRVVGTIGIYNGDTEIEFFEAEMVQVLDPGTGEILPMPMSTYQASLEENQGWLSVITGTVTSKVGEDTLYVEDGSGSVRVFLDGYNGNFTDINVNDLVRVTGLVSEDGYGPRIRVRNYIVHPEYADDVVVLPQTLELSIAKTVNTPQQVLPGSLITYTVALNNTGTGAVLQTALTDTLPPEITFGGFVQASGSQYQNGIVTWNGTVWDDMDLTVIFTATVDEDYSLYSQTVTNTAEFTTGYANSGSAQAAFTVVEPPDVTIDKGVEVPEIINPGCVVTYTLGLANHNNTTALDVVMTDTLPAGISFGGWVWQSGAVEQDGVITWEGDLPLSTGFIFTATVGYDPSFYGQTITNLAEFTSANDGEGTASAAFEVGTPDLSLTKTVETGHDPARPGDPITYTIVLRNDGNADAVDVHIWDTLPDYVVGEDLNMTTTISAGATYTITISATLATDVPWGHTATNTAYYQSGDLSGESSASFTVAALRKYYLPFIFH